MKRHPRFAPGVGRRACRALLALAIAAAAPGCDGSESAPSSGDDSGVMCDDRPRNHDVLAHGARRLYLHPGRQHHLHVELRATASGTSSSPARPCASNQGEHGHGDPAQHAARGDVHHLPRPGGRAGRRQPRAAAVHSGGSLTSLVQPAAPAAGTVTYSSSPAARHLPLRDRHRQRQAAPDGPVRRARRAARRHRRPGQRPVGLGVQPERRSTSTCCPRSTPTCTWRSSAASRSTHQPSTPRYLMINGRSIPDTLAPNNAAWLPAQPYGVAGAHPAVRRDDQSAAGARSATSTRGTRQPPVPPARQRRARHQAATGRSLQGRDGMDQSYREFTRRRRTRRRPRRAHGLARRRELERRDQPAADRPAAATQTSCSRTATPGSAAAATSAPKSAR